MERTPTKDIDQSLVAEEVLHAVTEASDDAIVSLDGTGRVLSWNRSAERIFGYRAAEIIGQPSAGLFPAHLREGLAELLETVVTGDGVDHVDLEMNRRDGMPVPVSISARPIVDREADGLVALLVVRDVTEQHLAQATLAEVEDRLREAERLSGTGSWLWDRRTDSVQWSDEHHRIHGRDPMAFDGTIDAHLRCIHDDDREAVRDAINRAIDSGHPFEAEYRVVLPDGDVRRVYTRAEPTMGSAGTVVGLRGIGREVTP